MELSGQANCSTPSLRRLRRQQLRRLARRVPADRLARTSAGAREELALGPSNCLVAPERVALALEPEPCPQTRPAEIVAQHAEAVPRDEAGIVRQRRRHVADFHPTLG